MIAALSPLLHHNAVNISNMIATMKRYNQLIVRMTGNSWIHQQCLWTMFVTINVSDKPVALQELDFFPETLEAPLEFVQNELEIFEDNFEDIFYDAALLPEEPSQPDVFIYTSEHIVCGIRQCFFNLTRHIGQTDSVAFEGYSRIDSGKDDVVCGQGCRNEELDDNQKVEVIGCHGSIDKPPFDIGSNLTKVHGEDKQPIILRIPERICAGEGTSLFAVNHMRAAGRIVNDVPTIYGGQQCIRLHDSHVIPLHYHQGLCHMKTHFPTDDDLKTVPVFDLTLDTPWNPGNEFDEDTMVAAAAMRDIYQFATKRIMLYDDAELQDPIMAEAEAQINDSYATWTAGINKLTSEAKNVDWQHLIPCFAWQPQSAIRKMLENTTQCYRTTSS